MNTQVKYTDTWKFSELDAATRQKAISNLYDINVDYEWWDCTYDNAENVGIKITSFDLDRNRHATATIYDPAETAHLIILNHGESCETYKTAKSFLAEYMPVKTYHDRLETIEYNSNSRFGTADKLYHMQEILADLCDDFRQSITEDYSIMLQEEYEYLTSNEAIIETIEANDYDFTGEGRIY